MGNTFAAIPQYTIGNTFGPINMLSSRRFQDHCEVLPVHQTYCKRLENASSSGRIPYYWGQFGGGGGGVSLGERGCCT